MDKINTLQMEIVMEQANCRALQKQIGDKDVSYNKTHATITCEQEGLAYLMILIITFVEFNYRFLNESTTFW